jgi:hypothetical protein
MSCDKDEVHQIIAPEWPRRGLALTQGNPLCQQEMNEGAPTRGSGLAELTSSYGSR